MIQVRPVLDIPIFHKAYDLYKLLHSSHHRIPKAQRYTLWQKSEMTALELIEALIETSYKQDDERIQVLFKISNKLDLLKVFIRLAKETRAIDNKQYVQIQSIVQEIGKMTGGWIKHLSHQEVRPR